MTNELTPYSTAKRALAEARSIDDVKNVLDKAMALRVYAQRAKDKTLEEDALEIRLRAERKAGQMMREQGETIGFDTGGHRGSGRNPQPPSLASQGIDKYSAHRFRTAASMTDLQFEDHLKDIKSTCLIGAGGLTRKYFTGSIIESLRDVLNKRANYGNDEIVKLRRACEEFLRETKSEESITWLRSLDGK